jgi:hypothetical protein
MNKHSRAFSRLGKGKPKRQSAVERRRSSRKQIVPDQMIELAAEAIRDGHTTVASFLAPFHPDLRFTAFRAYTSAMFSFMAKCFSETPLSVSIGTAKHPSRAKRNQAKKSPRLSRERAKR